MQTTFTIVTNQSHQADDAAKGFSEPPAEYSAVTINNIANESADLNANIPHTYLGAVVEVLVELPDISVPPA
jgi:hypothetical protein